MRLRPLTPSLPIDLQPLIALLARPPLSLHTTEALLFAGISGDSPGHTDAKIASHLPADSGFSARDVARLRKEALKLDSGAGGGEDDSWFAGDAAFREEKQQRAMIQAAGVAFGVRELDGLVTGRAGRGVIEVYGHERGGKTVNRCLLFSPAVSLTRLRTRPWAAPRSSCGPRATTSGSEVLSPLDRHRRAIRGWACGRGTQAQVPTHRVYACPQFAQDVISWKERGPSFVSSRILSPSSPAFKCSWLSTGSVL